MPYGMRSRVILVSACLQLAYHICTPSFWLQTSRRSKDMCGALAACYLVALSFNFHILGSEASSLCSPMWNRALRMPWQGHLDVDDDPVAAAPPHEVAEGKEGHQNQRAPGSFKMQFLGTWTHTARPDLKAPRDATRAAFGELLLRLLAGIFRVVEGGRRRCTNRVIKVAVFRELHENGEAHFHFPILAERPWYTGPLKDALRNEGIAVDFSGDHDFYWTTMVYLTVPGTLPGQKREEELDAEPWLCPGHPSIPETLQEMPRGARASDKARVRRYLQVISPSSSNSQSMAYTHRDFARHIVEKALRTPLELQAWVATMSQRASENGSNMTVDERLQLAGVESYMYVHQGDLHQRMAFAWETIDAPRALAQKNQTPWQRIQLAAEQYPCLCGNRWIAQTEALLALQVEHFPQMGLPAEKPDSPAVQNAMKQALLRGCQKHTNVFIYGPTGAGKSHMLKPLQKIFGDAAFVRPAGTSTYPLLGLFGKKVAVIQDLRVDTFRLPFADLLIRWEGEPFRVPRPQNRYDGDRVYHEGAPVFASSGDKLRITLAEALRTSTVPERQNAMMDQRWRCFLFAHTLRRGEEDVETCGRCFAQWLLQPVPAPDADGH